MGQRKAADSEPADSWYGLRSAFLAALNDDQKLRIFDLTTRASRELHRWAARYPLIRRVRVWPVTLSVVAATPFASAAAIATITRMSLWVFSIDDLFDEEMAPFAELQRRVALYTDILAGAQMEPRRERDTLALALHNIRQDMTRYALFEPLREQWAEAITRTLAAMVREHEWRTLYLAPADTPWLPAYEAYLSDGIYSIGGPPHIWTTVIALEDPSALDHRERLHEMAAAASVCLRLANDLASYSKEVAEGKINAIVIRQWEAMGRGVPEGFALEQAREQVQRELALGLARCDHLRQQVGTATGQPEQAIADIAHFVSDFYLHHDYHTFMAGSGRL